MSLGFAFGLFAIFSMLRYRTEQISTRDMTYLFLTIVLSLLSAVSPLSRIELPLTLFFLVALVITIEKLVQNREIFQQTLRYDRIENLKFSNRGKLLADLAERTGLEIRDVKVLSMDFLQDSAMLTIVCSTPSGKK